MILSPVPDDGFYNCRHERTRERLCRFCSTQFDSEDWRKEFCSKKCRTAWDVYWRAKGPALARLLHGYRYARRPQALTELCGEFSAMMDDFQKVRREVRKEATNAK